MVKSVGANSFVVSIKIDHDDDENGVTTSGVQLSKPYGGTGRENFPESGAADTDNQDNYSKYDTALCQLIGSVKSENLLELLNEIKQKIDQTPDIEWKERIVNELTKEINSLKENKFYSSEYIHEIEQKLKKFDELERILEQLTRQNNELQKDINELQKKVGSGENSAVTALRYLGIALVFGGLFYTCYKLYESTETEVDANIDNVPKNADFLENFHNQLENIIREWGYKTSKDIVSGVQQQINNLGPLASSFDFGPVIKQAFKDAVDSGNQILSVGTDEASKFDTFARNLVKKYLEHIKAGGMVIATGTAITVFARPIVGIVKLTSNAAIWGWNHTEGVRGGLRRCFVMDSDTSSSEPVVTAYKRHQNFDVETGRIYS